MDKTRSYICIDLKSFYASVECVERGLDPMTTNLVVADPTRTEKTICLAVSPALKTFGIPGRPRLFEVVQRVAEVNKERLSKLKTKSFSASSSNLTELNDNPLLKVDYLIAPPQMAKYMEISARIYDVYLKYVSAADMHVYSVDEVFIDVTEYLNMYKTTAEELARKMINDVYAQTGITATVGIGDNLYLSKVAMDVLAKRMKPDKNGVRLAILNEELYRKEFWAHTPLTDFWRVGKAYERRLNALGLFTMGDIARCSLGGKFDYHNEDLLYKEFGVNAELLIDHAWGWEPTTISQIKSYVPTSNSLSVGQVLERGYLADEAKIVVKEMADSLALDIIAKDYKTDLVWLTIGYDVENLSDDNDYQGEITLDWYGRKTPKGAHGSHNFGQYTRSNKRIIDAFDKLFDKIADKTLSVRRMYVGANVVLSGDQKLTPKDFIQTSMFETPENVESFAKSEKKDEMVSKSVIKIQGKYGKNAILKGISYKTGATQRKRNGQIGGHKA